MMSVSQSIETHPMAAAAAPRLELRDLSCVFQVGGSLFRRGTPLRAVDNVSISVGRGEVLGIVGESGSGKTTLGRMMLGLQPSTAGQILIDGEPISGVDRIALSRRVQPIFQDPYSSLNPRKTIGQIITFPLQVHGIGTRQDRPRRVEAMMEKVGLPARLIHTYPSQLSGGQRQRVAVARALITEPEIIICDEPTSALDVSVQAQILNLLRDLQEELNLTYVFISHALGVVEYLADSIAVMYMGQIVEYAGTTELMNNPRHPYTQALLSSILTPDPSLGLPDLYLGRGFPDPLHPPAGCRFHPRCPHAGSRCSVEAPHDVLDAVGRVKCHLATEAGVNLK